MKAAWARGLGGIGVCALLCAALFGRAQTPANEPESVPPAAAKDAPATAPVVVGVRIVKQGGEVLAESPQGLAIATGQPLDREQVAASLRALYRTGDYADIEAATVPVSGGVRVDFLVRENLFFNRIIIEGLKPPPSDASAASAMQISLGQTFRQASVDAGLDRLRSVLQDDGLYQAKVSAEAVPHEATHQMDVVVRVEPGPRAHFGAIHLTNETEFPDEDILDRLKLKSGREVTALRIQQAADRVRKFLAKKGHLSGRAALRRGEYDAATNTLPLTADISEGPRVRIVVNGAKFSRGELKRLLPIYQEGAVDTDLLEEGKRNLRERLERNGYFDSTVDYSTAIEPVKSRKGTVEGRQATEEVITYTVDRGVHHKLVGIGIKGNHYFSTELLRSRLQIYRAAFGSRGHFSQRLVDADRQSMLNLYHANGFLQATVDRDVSDNYQGKEGNLYILFTVDEGKQTRVASLEFSGRQAFSEADLLGVVGASPGQPYSESAVTTDRDNILALYYNEGYPEAQFRAMAEPALPEGTPPPADAAAKAEDMQKYGVKLTYILTEGPQTRVRQVLLTGYNHTRPKVIRREVQVKAGEPLRQHDVVETQRRLYNLGTFNRVTVEPQNPQGTDPEKDVVVLVEEAKRYTIAYGGGFEVQRLASTSNPTGSELQAAPRGIFEISKLNLTGRADSLSLKLRGSTIEDRALLAYNDPGAFGSPKLSLQATAYTERTQDINTFTENRYEASTQLTHQYSRFTTLAYSYAFRKVNLSNISANLHPEDIPLFEQPTLISEFGVTWTRDHRDNPADATKGNFNSAAASISDTGIGSSASFLRFFFQNSTYYPIKRRFGFARSFRFGVLQPYRDTRSLDFPLSNTGPLPQLIPLPERFFSGGGTSLRGFALNQSGPRDTAGFPIGGQALLVLNQEFRFPIRLPYFGTQLGGVLFYDTGNVYSRLDRITLRWAPPKPVFTTTSPTQCVFNCTNELNYLSHTIGFGVRYATPVGPIRVDLGYQLNRPLLVLPIPCPSSTPNCTPAGFFGGHLPRLQFSFNLGSPF